MSVISWYLLGQTIKVSLKIWSVVPGLKTRGGSGRTNKNMLFLYRIELILDQMLKPDGH